MAGMRIGSGVSQWTALRRIRKDGLTLRGERDKHSQPLKEASVLTSPRTGGTDGPDSTTRVARANHRGVREDEK